MSNTHTGGPAFPIGIDAFAEDKEGMTLRDYFAAKALPISYQFWMNDYYHPDAIDAELRAEDNRADFSPDMQDLTAETAYSLADAMLKARGA
jgi:hypothetical protein